MAFNLKYVFFGIWSSTETVSLCTILPAFHLYPKSRVLLLIMLTTVQVNLLKAASVLTLFFLVLKVSRLSQTATCARSFGWLLRTGLTVTWKFFSKLTFHVHFKHQGT